MSAFDAALAALHSDPQLSRTALYRVGGAADGVEVRVIWSERQIETTFGQSGAVVNAIQCDLRLVDIADPRGGDTVQDGQKLYEVLTVTRDAERLTANLIVKFLRIL